MRILLKIAEFGRAMADKNTAEAESLFAEIESQLMEGRGDAANERWINEVMEQAQVMASSWSLVGGRFDRGDEQENFEVQKADLRRMLTERVQAPFGTIDSRFLMHLRVPERFSSDSELLNSGAIAFNTHDETGEPIVRVHTRVDLRSAIANARAHESPDKPFTVPPRLIPCTERLPPLGTPFLLYAPATDSSEASFVAQANDVPYALWTDWSGCYWLEGYVPSPEHVRAGTPFTPALLEGSPVTLVDGRQVLPKGWRIRINRGHIEDTVFLDLHGPGCSVCDQAGPNGFTRSIYERFADALDDLQTEINPQ